MKKIFTLLFAAGLFTLAQAQPTNGDYRQTDQRSYNNSKDVVVSTNSYNKNDYYNNQNFSFDRDRDMQIARINNEYDMKIQSVQRNFFMNWFAKQKQIQLLQDQRQREISMIYVRDNDRRGDFGDHDHHSRDRW